jgi:SH3 domain-binding protein 5 (SH3BP5)
LNTQKERIQQLQSLLQQAKFNYSTALKNLEYISESIHKMRGELGVREPGVGAEASEIVPESENLDFNLDDVKYEAHSESRSTSRSRSEIGTEKDFDEDEEELETIAVVVEEEVVEVVAAKEDDVEALRMKVRSLAVRPIEGCGDGKQDETHENWESELNATVDKLDHLMLLREKTQGSVKSEPQSPVHFEQKPLKLLPKQNPFPLSIVSLQSLPTSQNALPFNSRFLTESTAIHCDNLVNKKRKLSLG